MGKGIVFGVGITGDGKSRDSETGKRIKSYTVWADMIRRCYDKKYHARQATYIECTVSEGWKYYPNFQKWHDANYQEGYHLDKDLLYKGNTVYSENNCVYLPRQINNLLTNSKAKRGEYPVGVSFNSSLGKYHSSLKKNGRTCNLGHYNTPEEAFEAYKLAKESYIKELAEEYYQKDLITKAAYEALLRYEISIND